MKKELVLKKRKLISLWVGKGLTYSFVMVFLLYFGLMLTFPSVGMKLFGFRHFVVISTSMEPTFTPGDIVIIRPVAASELQEGMIIGFYHDVRLVGKEEVVTHYFVKTEVVNGQTYYRTRREQSNVLDSWRLREEKIIGVYDFKVSGLGKAVLFFNDPLGFRIIMIDMILILLIVIILNPEKSNFVKERKKKIIDKIDKKK